MGRATGAVSAVFIGGVAAVGDISDVLALVLGAILPGAAPGGAMAVAPGAPTGAGAALDMEPVVAGAAGAMVLSFAFGACAVLPGEAFGAVVSTGAMGEPVGAGADDWAIAKPTDMKTAAESSKSVRILVSFV
jgi:hypothetical protein